MSPVDIIVTLGLVALGSYVQTLTGFAFGLIVIGSMTLTGMAPIATSAVVISALSLFNSLCSVWGKQRSIRWPLLWLLLAGSVPTIALGLWLLTVLGDYTGRLEAGLGALIVACSLLMTWKPAPRTTLAGKGTFVFTGLLSGVMGGLFATSGPPSAFTLYRQPLPMAEIRATLQTLFIFTALIRIGMAIPTGQVNHTTLMLSLAGMPVVFVATMIARRFRPPVSDEGLRRIAFGLLMLTGFSLMAAGLMAH
ncbi:sulfite exporter TauE/SafE family protein [Pokkaliibacter sp. CJK22405]|uniref:sulfite exporter TauE/SafE family protein n=1 Tax=Pokkaliibacter sp. CJK22405 TaxID=3384615 RepID=UPI00398566AC